MSAKKSRNEIPTIDVNLVTISTAAGKEFGFDTANQIEVDVQTEDTEAVRLVVKGRLRAQKPMESTITGHEITLHDNVFNPELVKVLQGGTILYFQDEGRTTAGPEETPFGFAKYTPPVAGSGEKGEIFTLNAYSAIYNAAGVITGYEKTSYPNCQGVPVAFNSEDGTFRAPEYTINSSPDIGEPPYSIDWIKELPELDDPDIIDVTITGLPSTTVYDSSGTSPNTFDVSTMFTTNPASGIGDITYEITGGDAIGTIVDSTVTLTGIGELIITATVAATATTTSATTDATLTVESPTP